MVRALMPLRAGRQRVFTQADSRRGGRRAGPASVTGPAWGRRRCRPCAASRPGRFRHGGCALVELRAGCKSVGRSDCANGGTRSLARRREPVWGVVSRAAPGRRASVVVSGVRGHAATGAMQESATGVPYGVGTTCHTARWCTVPPWGRLSTSDGRAVPPAERAARNPDRFVPAAGQRGWQRGPMRWRRGRRPDSKSLGCARTGSGTRRCCGRRAWRLAAVWVRSSCSSAPCGVGPGSSDPGRRASCL